MRDVKVGVQPQLGEPAGGPGRALHQLVAQQPVGGMQRLRGAEQVLFERDPLRSGRLAGGLDIL